MSHWVDDIVIDTNNHVTNRLDLLHEIQENLDILYKIQVVGKHGHFNSKTESSHTSQDKLSNFEKSG